MVKMTVVVLVRVTITAAVTAALAVAWPPVSGELQGAAEVKEGSRASTPKAGARAPAMAIQASGSGLTDAVPSPDGAHVASTARDGVLRVHDLATGALLAGFKVGLGSPPTAGRPLLAGPVWPSIKVALLS